MPSLDTNILLRLILQDNQPMLTAVKRELARHQEFAVSDQVVIEIVYILGGHYRYTRLEICAVTEALLANQHLKLNRDVLGQTLVYYRKHSAVSFVDCYLATTAKATNQVPLLTFDRKLANQLPHTQLVR